MGISPYLSDRRNGGKFSMLIWLRLLWLVPFFVSQVVCAEGSIRSPDEFFFDQSLGDFSEELENARDEGKQGVFIFFEMDECPFCHRMKVTVLNQPKVQAYFKQHFLNFVVNIDGDVEMVDFNGKTTTQRDFSFKQHRVRATPTMIFFDLTGQRISKYIGPTSGVEEFLLLGEYIVSEAYKKGSFSRYKRAQRRANAK